MAQYKYLGPTPRSYVTSFGVTKALIFRTKDGTRLRLDAPDQERGFKPDDIITIDNPDARITRALAVDPRFELQD